MPAEYTTDTPDIPTPVVVNFPGALSVPLPVLGHAPQRRWPRLTLGLEGVESLVQGVDSLVVGEEVSDTNSLTNAEVCCDAP